MSTRNHVALQNGDAGIREGSEFSGNCRTLSISDNLEFGRETWASGFGFSYVEGVFCAADVFEAVVGADGDGVFARGEAAQREFVVFARGVADVPDWREENPVAAVDAVLRAVDAAGGIARSELRD